MFGDGDSGVSGSSSGLSSGGFSCGSDSSPSSSGLGSFGSGNPSANGGSDGSGGIHSSLDGSSMAAPSGGSSTPSTNSLGSQATNDASTQASTPSTSYASPQATNDNSSTPAGGFSNPQADTSGTPTSGPTGGLANDNSNDSTKTAGASLDGSGFSGFRPNTTNDNTNAPSLNGAAGSSLSPSLGITGGTPYTNGFTFDSSMTAHDLSTVVTSNYDNYMHNYFDDTSGIQKTEDTLAKIDNAWDTAKQWGNETFVKPIQEALNAPMQVDTTTPIENQLAEGIPGMTQQEVENGFNRLNPTAALQNGNQFDNINDWVATNGITPVEVKSEGLGKMLSNGMGWDDDHGNPVKNTFLNSGDAGVAEGVSTLKAMTYGTVSAPALGYGAELEVAEKSLGISALKGISKFTGPLNIISTGYDIYGDCQKYEGKNLTKAVVADLGSYGAGLGAAALCVTFGAPVVAGIGICTGVAVLAGYASNSYKNSQLSPK